MKILPSYSNTNNSFGSNSRIYSMSNTKFKNKTSSPEMKTTTRFFREDLCWKNFIAYILDNFKNSNAVNIISYGASDCSEAYSMVIALIESTKNAQKFFPIKAYDCDKEIIKSAMKGRIKITENDKSEISKFTNNFGKYFTRTDKCINIPNDILVPSSAPNPLLRKFYTTNNYIVSPVLKSRVNIQEGDAFELVNTLEKDTDTIVLCRNFLPYFNNDTILEFFKTVSSKLKKDSILVFGLADDADIPLDLFLNKFGFKKVMQYVYQKQ